jgi:hypothetical protein
MNASQLAVECRVGRHPRPACGHLLKDRQIPIDTYLVVWYTRSREASCVIHHHTRTAMLVGVLGYYAPDRLADFMLAAVVPIARR